MLNVNGTDVRLVTRPRFRLTSGGYAYPSEVYLTDGRLLGTITECRKRRDAAPTMTVIRVGTRESGRYLDEGTLSDLVREALAELGSTAAGPEGRRA